jgi:deoxyribodipyrimidine photo-lyase
VTELEPINLVWLKRDLRLTDHAPLADAATRPEPLSLIYCFEPELLDDPHYDERHWRFIWQSLDDLDRVLAPLGGKVHRLWGSVTALLEEIDRSRPVAGLFSHQETGLAVTFERDKAVADWCRTRGVPWHESPTGAVQRGLPDRRRWDRDWYRTLGAAPQDPELERIRWVVLPEDLGSGTAPESWCRENPAFQRGGIRTARQTLASFLEHRGRDYRRAISSPSASREHCSRLSPYLAWGNLSLRQVYQATLERRQAPGWRYPLTAFSSRLHWHCHFIQKFESECAMEHRPVNRAYEAFPYRTDDRVEDDLQAWREGQTGIPLVDACMRCLHQTGYINFRMRAMLVSVLCHHLNIDWRRGVTHLARLFLDFEPGIHYPQFQMQAGVTGVNTIRIYNPVRQAEQQDADGTFTRQWLPELAELPVPLLHRPWERAPMERLMFDLSYPEPILDVTQAARSARERLWSWRSRDEVKREARRVLGRHVRPS